jgi:hypothetical protein
MSLRNQAFHSISQNWKSDSFNRLQLVDNLGSDILATPDIVVIPGWFERFEIRNFHEWIISDNIDDLP